MKTALILCASPQGITDAEKEYILGLHPDVFICVDGGMKQAADLKITPDVLVGDGDSGGFLFEFDGKTVKLPVEKDVTDLQAAIDIACESACGMIYVFGALGGRQDHSLANLLLLEYAHGLGMSGLILDAQNEIRFFPGGTFEIENDLRYRFISILPLDPVLSGITLTGLKYPLKDTVLSRGDTLTMSNEFTSSTAKIEIKSGRSLIIRSNS